MDQGDDRTTDEPDVEVDDELDDEGEPEVEGFVVSPRDAASGLPTGKRMHKPFELGLGFTVPTPSVAPPNPIEDGH
jgi:hypothetical protein